MHLKISVILLHLFTTTLPISQQSANTLSVLATSTDRNDTQSSQIRRIATITTTTTITTETCNEPYCYNLLNRTNEMSTPFQQPSSAHGEQSHFVSNNDSVELLSNVIASHVNDDRLMSSSIVYGLLKIANSKKSRNTCITELNKIYDGIHRKEIWAMKGRLH